METLEAETERKGLRAYRIGGNFNLVRSNLQRLAQRKCELGLERPAIVWQFLAFRHNEEDIGTASSPAAYHRSS